MTVNRNIARKSQPPAPIDEAAELLELAFGEFLVTEGVLDRYQLFRALQMQDHAEGVRLGECAAALGYAPIGAIERLFQRYLSLQTVLVA